MSGGDRGRAEAAALRALARLSSVVRASGTYPLDHPSLTRAIDGARDALNEVMETTGPVTLRILEERVLLGETPVRVRASAKQSLALLVPRFQALDAGGIDLVDPPSYDDCLGLCRVLVGEQGGAPDPRALDYEAARNALLDTGVRSIRLLAVDQEQEEAWHEHSLAPEVACLAAYLDAIQAVRQLYEDGLDSGVVVRLTRAGQELVDAIIRWPSRAAVLVSPRHHIPYELRHPVHVAILGGLMGSRLGMAKGELLELILCAFAIDCGMATIPESIRNKKAALDERERALIEAHPIESVKALLASPNLGPGVRRRVRVAFESHLGFDAGGYPQPLRWNGLHLYSRIVALADGYDALRADTPYRKSMPQSQALSVIRSQAGTRYDPALTALLLETIKQLQDRLDKEDPHAW